HVRVRGEVSGYRGPHSSGHVYFTLKDQNARIDAVIWKGVFGRLRIRPEEGMEVIATGKVSTFPGSSKYQIVIEALEPAGVGALMALLEARRKALGAEGLFDPARKQLLPFLPRIIGVVTSPTGAVIRDILHRLSDRFPRHVLVWPVRVQGETSAAEVAAAIRGFNALPAGGRIPRPDVLIVARGGGSLEDLWGFNEEVVVRAAADSDIPLIAAVGHETDWTLIDLAADIRAPTPTGAAEMAVPVRADLIGQVDDLVRRLSGASRRYLGNLGNELRGVARGLPQPGALLAVPRQRVDLASQNLPLFLRRRLREGALLISRLGSRLAQRSPGALLAARRGAYAALAARLPDLIARRRTENARQLTVLSDRLARAIAARTALEHKRIQTDAIRLEGLARRLTSAVAAKQSHEGARLEGLAKLLGSLSYRSVLDRGYAVVRDSAGRPVMRAAAIGPGAVLSIEFADAAVPAMARPQGAPIEPAPARPSPPKPAKPGGGSQGSLF
ncbi:MAG: exodeoxyribonuclease VII large subunit, partial [Beijerinckiaceae bacterium]